MGGRRGIRIDARRKRWEGLIGLVKKWAGPGSWKGRGRRVGRGKTVSNNRKMVVNEARILERMGPENWTRTDSPKQQGNEGGKQGQNLGEGGAQELDEERQCQTTRR